VKDHPLTSGLCRPSGLAHPQPGALMDRRIMISAESSRVGAQLDAHHAPETNGRMSVCRRCGSLTDSPAGLQHTPHTTQVDRSSQWLTAQSRLRHIEQARGRLEL
jgi:hypothetical protein